MGLSIVPVHAAFASEITIRDGFREYSPEGNVMSNKMSSPSVTSRVIHRPASVAVGVICLMVSVVAFLFPALWNNFAIVFFDTSGYVSRVLEMKLLPGRSIFYGLFLWLTSLGWRSFYGPPLLQSLFCVWLVYLMLRCHGLPAGPVVTATICVILGVFTGVSWYASQLEPDALVPLVVLVFWLLGFHWQSLKTAERAGLTIIVLLGIMSHMSCLALAIGLVGVVLFARVLVSWRRWSLKVSIIPPLVVLTLSLALIPMLHLALVGKVTYNAGGPEYIFGRLVQDGIPQRWLAEHCPVAGVKLCGLQNRIPYNGDEFLWGEKSAFRDIGEWTGSADKELGFLNRECFKAYPGAVAWTALRAAAEQLMMVETGDGLDEIHNETRYVFARLLTRTAASFNAAKQQQGQLTQALFDALNRVHVPVAYLSFFGLLAVVGWGLSSGRHDLAGAAVFVLLALLGNAFICGALSNPHHRYQSRIVWLAPLIVTMAVICWWQLRTKPKGI